MLDLSAAFGMVDLNLLLEKLIIYGFHENAIEWIKSYLIERSQKVLIDGALSDPKNVEVGVPQGSILGPLFYILFTNNLPEVLHKHLPNYNLHHHHQINPQDHQSQYNVFNTSCSQT